MRPASAWEKVKMLLTDSRPVRLLPLTVCGIIIVLAGLGLTDISGSRTAEAMGVVTSADPDVKFVGTFTNDDGVVDDPNSDPNDNGVDPGYDKHVAGCAAAVDSSTGAVRLTITDGYPSYTCRFWVIVQNVGTQPVRRAAVSISAPPELTVTDIDPQPADILYPGQKDVEEFVVHVEQTAVQQTGYAFAIEKTYAEEDTGPWGTTLTAYKTAAGFHEQAGGADVYGARGQVCVTNAGDYHTVNLKIVDCVEYKLGAGQYQPLACEDLDLSARPVLYPGESACYPYEIRFMPPAPNATYRNAAKVTIENHAGWLPGGPHCSGPDLCPFGPEPKTGFSLPSGY
jgi:hypothetical protein